MFTRTAKCVDDGVVVISLTFAGLSFAVITPVNRDGNKTCFDKFAAEREHVRLAAARAV
jgi:hypothetical protein